MMAKAYTYHVDIYDDGEWRRQLASEDQTVDERTYVDVARTVLEGWVVARPGLIVGGGRIVTFDEEEFDHRLDGPSSVRALVFRGAADAHEAAPAAAAYLLDDPDIDDPHGWVNPP